jgi:predicted methyltransferase
MKLHHLIHFGFAAALWLPGAAVWAGDAAPAVSPAVRAAVANAQRPAADTARDADRKPDQAVAFSGLKPGDRVVDLLPGGGYYSRIFSGVAGPKGHVYAYYGAEAARALPKTGDRPFPGFDNVTALRGSIGAVSAPEPVDMVWTSNNYHDLHNPPYSAAGIGDINKSVYDALKPGGIYIVIDHAAQAGSGARDTGTRHRIDEALVKKQVEAAGFKLIGESKALRNPADNHQARVNDPAIRGKTDQFILKFRKPK